jgi:hypothetical protein
VKVKVEYLFSKNKKVGSLAIRLFTLHLSYLGFKDTPSHAAILINGRWVHESTLSSGVTVMTYKKWLQSNTVVSKILCENKLEYSKVKENFRNTKGKSYDWPGVLYLAFFIFLNLILGISIPENNKWNSKNRYFCTEVLGNLLGINLSMKSPVETMSLVLPEITSTFNGDSGDNNT